MYASKLTHTLYAQIAKIIHRTNSVLFEIRAIDIIRSYASYDIKYSLKKYTLQQPLLNQCCSDSTSYITINKKKIFVTNGKFTTDAIENEESPYSIDIFDDRAYLVKRINGLITNKIQIFTEHTKIFINYLIVIHEGLRITYYNDQFDIFLANEFDMRYAVSNVITMKAPNGAFCMQLLCDRQLIISHLSPGINKYSPNYISINNIDDIYVYDDELYALRANVIFRLTL